MERQKKMYTYILHWSESDQCRFKYTSFFSEVFPVTNPATATKAFRCMGKLNPAGRTISETTGIWAALLRGNGRGCP